MLLQNTDRGLFCEKGDFYVDPWRGVDVAVITHAHSDHARFGSNLYLAEESGRGLLQQRLGPTANIKSLRYGETISRNGVQISLHPAGHVLGSAQVRIEYQGEICVVSGDYKLQRDATCQPFDAIRCHTFVTESTFGLPIYHWRPSSEIYAEMNEWWRASQAQGWTSIIYCYSLGKAQRVLSGLDGNIGPIFVHGAVDRFLPVYREAGVHFPETQRATTELARAAAGRGLILAPPSADNTPWLRKFGDVATAFASGWMQIRGARRRRSLDRGFVMSDHADWSGLLETIDATGAENIWVTHGYTGQLVRWLREHGRNAEAIATRFEGEEEGVAEPGEAAESA